MTVHFAASGETACFLSIVAKMGFWLNALVVLKYVECPRLKTLTSSAIDKCFENSQFTVISLWQFLGMHLKFFFFFNFVTAEVNISF